MLEDVTDLAGVKSLFSQFTAVGEYCGNPNLEHFVEYPKETILFYALVDKFKQQICLPPCKTLQLLAGLKLSAVTI